jgi:hypothetical protein
MKRMPDVIPHDTSTWRVKLRDGLSSEQKSSQGTVFMSKHLIRGLK